MQEVAQRSIDVSDPDSWAYLLTTTEVQRITRIGKVKLLSMLNNGEFPGKRVRGRWLVPKDSLLEWIKEDQ